MDELNARIEALRTEIADLRAGDRTLEAARRIIEANAELTAATAELAEFEAAEAALTALDAAAEAGGGEGDGEAEGEGDAEEAPAEEAPAAAERVLVTASAEGDISPTADSGATRPVVTLTASASLGGVSSGTQLDQSSMMRLLNGTLRAGASESPQTRMLEISRFAEGREAVTAAGSSFENSRIMRDAAIQGAQPQALTAAACWCVPDRVENDVAAVGDSDRPVAGLFPAVPVDGPFRYVPDLCLVDTGSVNKWTCADQAAVDPDDPLTWKQCSELDCFTENTVTPYFVTACTTVSRIHQFQHPNQIEAWLDAIRINYAQDAETRLLDQIEADAGAALTVGAVAGTMAAHGLLSKLLYALGSVSFALGYEFRSEGLAGRTLIIPRGMIDALLTDENIRGFSRDVARAEVIRLISANYGINLVERKDESTARKAIANASVADLNNGGALDTSPVVTAPPSWRVYLVDPSQYRRGEGSLVGADWHVDTALLRQNKLMWFMENMEFLELVGCKKPYTIDITGCINGARSDLVAPPAC